MSDAAWRGFSHWLGGVDEEVVENAVKVLNWRDLGE